jgi:penicillin-binding protein-related factor A (putative recombinase)
MTGRGNNTPKLESKFQKDVLYFLRKVVGGHWIKIHASAFQLEGEPDIVGVYNGRFYAFELKQGTYQPTDLQLFKLEKIREAGGIADVIRDLDQLKIIFYGSTTIPFSDK